MSETIKANSTPMNLQPLINDDEDIQVESLPPVPPRPHRRRRWLIALVVIVILALLGGGGVDNLDRYGRKFVEYLRAYRGTAAGRGA